MAETPTPPYASLVPPRFEEMPFEELPPGLQRRVTEARETREDQP